AKQIEKQIDTLVQECGDKQTEAAKLETKIQDAQKVLESEPLITAKVAELEQIKSQIPALEAKETRLRELQTEEKRLSKDEMTLADEQEELARRIVHLMCDIGQRDDLQLANEQHQQSLAELKVLDEKAEQWQELQDQQVAIEKETDKQGDIIRGYENDIKILQKEIDSCQKKAEILLNSGCVDPVNATCKFLKDAQEAKQNIPKYRDELEAVKELMSDAVNIRVPLLEQLEKLDKQQIDLQYDKRKHATLKKQSEALRLKAELYASLSGKEELLQTVQQQHKQLDERIGVINDQALAMQRDIQLLKKETESLPILKASIPSLEKYVEYKDKLPEAKAVIQTAKESITKLDTEIAAKNEQREALQNNFLELNGQIEYALPGKTIEAERVQQALKKLQVDSNNLYVDQGTYQSKIDELAKQQADYDTLTAELAPTAKELVRWQTLIKAFGKSGIPALIIENSIPELERISNDILSQMTNGQNSLRFDTQRDKKDGKGQIETLDIWVNDDSGYERIYETYSGGEALRIDLAIRLGLAELLCNRSGSKVEFVVGDELFGSQDKEHIDLVIQALKAIAPRFKKVLIITHIETAQAMFDQQIVISEGGKIEIQFN
ncbi:MAG: SMC family ATPase, partial [Candidatus Paceibacterota bacterium]